MSIFKGIGLYVKGGSIMDNISNNQIDSLKEHLMVFDTLSRNFSNVYLINIEKKTAKILKLNASYVDVPGKTNHQEFLFESVIHHWIETIVYEEDREKIRKAFEIENIRNALKTKDECVGSYRSFVNGEIHYFQYRIIKSSEDGKMVVVGFQNIDDIIQEHKKIEEENRKKEYAHQKEVADQFAIIMALSKSFRNVFVADLKMGTARAIRLAENYNVKAIRDVDNMTFQFDAVIDRWVRETVHPDDKKRIKATLNVENIRKIFAKQDSYVGTYRNIEDGIEHYYQYDFRRVDNTDFVVVGFQLIDKIIEEQRENQRREKTLEEARFKEEKERLEVIDSLSTIYSTIFQAYIVTHRYEILTSIPLMGELVQTQGNFDDVKEIIINAFIEPEFRESMNEFLDIDTLSSRLAQANTITTDYKAPTGQWMQSRFIVKRRDEKGRAIEALYVARDVSEEKLVKFEAEHDVLTGVLNRGGFNQILNSKINEKKNFALIVIDIDDFKDVNDNFGHAVGDLILKKVSKLLGEKFRSLDYICRIGGDEFAIIMMDVTSRFGYKIMDKIDMINQSLSEPGEDIPVVTLSAGVAFMDKKSSRESLFEDADSALYYVKKHGRKGCHIYSKEDSFDDEK